MISTMMLRRALSHALLAVAIASAGCGQTPTLAPPELHPNQDTCHECGMTVSDVRHAAAIVFLRDGMVEHFVFDDTGEMLESPTPPGVAEVRRYVHDFQTGQWIDAATAHFIRASELHTPMATGIVAFSDQAAARAAASTFHGEVLDHPPDSAATRPAADSAAVP